MSDSVRRQLTDALGGRAASALISILSIALVARFTDTSTYGLYATAVGFAMLLALFGDFGSSVVAVRDASTDAEKQSASRTYLQLRGVLILATMALGAVVVLFAFPSDARSTAWLALLVLPLGGPAIVAPVGQIFGTMRFFRTASLIQGGAQLAALCLVLTLSESPTSTQLVLSTIFGAAIATAMSIRFARSLVESPFLVVDRDRLRDMAKSMLVVGAALGVTAAYVRIDGILLLNIAGPDEAGQYAAAYRFLDQSALITTAIMAPLAPLLARNIAAHDRVPAPLDESLKRIEATASLGLSFIIIATASLASLVLLGPRFDDTADILIVLAVSQAWVLFSFSGTARVVYARRESRYLGIACVGLLINVAGNLLLIPSHGVFGAAAATLLTEFVVVIGFVAVTRHIGTAGREWLVLRNAVLAFIVGGLVIAAKSEPLAISIVVQVVVFAVGTSLLVAGWQIVRSDLDR